MTDNESTFSVVSVVTLEDSEEIEQLVKCLPKTMGGSY